MRERGGGRERKRRKTTFGRRIYTNSHTETAPRSEERGEGGGGRGRGQV